MRVELQKVLNLAIGIPQGLLICRKSHHGVEQRLATKGYFEKSRVEEIGKVFADAVMIMRDVLVEVIKTRLKFDRKVLPVRHNVDRRFWERGCRRGKARRGSNRHCGR